MSHFVGTKKPLSDITKLAYKLMEKYSEEIEECEAILDAVHKIGGMSISQENFPNDFLMASLSSLLSDQDIKFAIIGAIAAAAYGAPRHTEDIDCLVSDLPDVSNADYAARFGFYRSKSSTGSVMTIDHRKTGYVELLKSNNSLYEYALSTAVMKNIFGYSVPVVAPDALIAMKVMALTENPSREYKDFSDIIAVYKLTSPDLTNVKVFLSEKELAKLSEILPGL